MKALFYTLLVSFALQSDTFSREAAILKVHHAHTTVELHSTLSQAQRGGFFYVYLEITPDAGWYTYWQNPGTAGLPTQVTMRLTEGASAKPMEFPTPQATTKSGIDTYYYDYKHFLFIPILIPEDFKGDTLSVEADVSWMTCNVDSCIPGKATLNLPAIKIDDDQGIWNKTPEGYDASASSLPIGFKNEGIAHVSDTTWTVLLLKHWQSKDKEIAPKNFYPITQNIIPIEGERRLKETKEGADTFIEITFPRDSTGSVPENIQLLLTEPTVDGQPLLYTAKVVKKK